MLNCSKDDLIEPVSEQIEMLLKDQLKKEFALIEITTRSGEVIHLRSNSIQAKDNEKNDLPRKKILLNDVRSTSRITYSGSPYCVLLGASNGSSLMIRLDGGDISECYR